MPKAKSKATSKATSKALSLEDILYAFQPITDVHYEPFKCEPKQTAKALLPESFPPKPHPFDYFSLFFTPDLFYTITTNTNRYASIQSLHVPQKNAREWTNLLVKKLYVFIGGIIYIGVYEEPKIAPTITSSCVIHNLSRSFVQSKEESRRVVLQAPVKMRGDTVSKAIEEGNQLLMKFVLV